MICVLSISKTDRNIDFKESLEIFSCKAVGNTTYKTMYELSKESTSAPSFHRRLASSTT